MGITTTIITVFIVIAYLLFKPKQRKVKSIKSIEQRSRKHNPYSAASIYFKDKDCACTAVKSIDDKRFLCAEVPIIPLAECNLQQCRCRYVRYQDRRAVDDRRAISSLRSNPYSVAEKSDRRTALGRRESDFTSEVDYGYGNLDWWSAQN